jgi:hypothetical protein
MNKLIPTFLGGVIVASIALVSGDASSKPPGNTTSRFIVLSEFNDQAVQDTATGLVWMRSPHPAYGADSAIGKCASLAVGDTRLGWRLPELHEIGTLLDLSAAQPYFLPAGHPFQNLTTLYWTQTRDASGGLVQMWMDGYGGEGYTVRARFGASGNAGAWCVRDDI